ncbi:hypothetical protein BDV93DRAFT_515732 [Ceratobasidium sp. AG-I]|nr:hypothetical protein BDV93DRAFT_515732 [Ceratobasidium sp. AG-I]
MNVQPMLGHNLATSSASTLLIRALGRELVIANSAAAVSTLSVVHSRSTTISLIPAYLRQPHHYPRRFPFSPSSGNPGATLLRELSQHVRSNVDTDKNANSANIRSFWLIVAPLEAHRKTAHTKSHGLGDNCTLQFYSQVHEKAHHALDHFGPFLTLPSTHKLLPGFLMVEPVESLSPPSAPATPEVVSCPPTPEGLHDAAFPCLGLLASASGVNGYGHNTPRPLPRQPPRVIHRPPAPVLPPDPPLAHEQEIALGDCTVNIRLAYILAMGRWEECKCQQPHTLDEAAGWARDMELLQPGMIDWLSDTFFPQGYIDWSLARPRFIFLRDFILGWWALAPDGQ